jgi:hypothetical protein
MARIDVPGKYHDQNNSTGACRRGYRRIVFGMASCRNGGGSCNFSVRPVHFNGLALRSFEY